MKKNMAIIMIALSVVMTVLTGCNSSGTVPATSAITTPKPTPAEYVLTIEMVQDGACAIANAFVENKISVERALDGLAAVNKEISEALDNIAVENRKKNKKLKKSNENVGIAIAQKTEVDGLEVLEGDIEDLRSYISDYYANGLSMSVIEKRVKNMEKTDYSLFNE